MRAWYFEKCCQLQMDVLKSSRPYRVLSSEQLESSKASLDAEFPPGMSSAVKNYVLKQEQQR